MLYLEMTASLQHSLQDRLEEWLYTVKKKIYILCLDIRCPKILMVWK